jgi:hypothetical protein
MGVGGRPEREVGSHNRPPARMGSNPEIQKFFFYITDGPPAAAAAAWEDRKILYYRRPPTAPKGYSVLTAPDARK